MSNLLRATVTAGLVVGAALTLLGILANWYPPLDVVNNGLPVFAVGTVALLALAVATCGRAVIGATALLLAAMLILLITGLTGAAPQAPDGATRFLRVATFNLWGRNDHTDSVMAFIDKTGADAIVLEEVRSRHKDLLMRLGERYPNRVGDEGLVLLSKYPILADGRIDRAGEPYWQSLIVRWAKLAVNDKTVMLAGAHLARPFYPELQQADILRLTRFVEEQNGPLILAGDFNMAPWTVKLKAFTNTTGLGRFNTYYPTWPMRWRNLQLLPFVPIDNVFASRQFASLGTKAGPRLGSDHRPVIADIALVE